MSITAPRPPRLPPRPAMRAAWRAHRMLYRLSRGRLGLARARPGRGGTMRVTTIGRRSGREHAVMLGYLEDGPLLVTLAMNGGADPDPAWWLNLQAHPDVRVDLPDGPRLVHARAAAGSERARLWERWRGIHGDLDALAAGRSHETAVVVFESRPGPAGGR